MELTELGFNDWFQKVHAESPNQEYRLARITRVDRSQYLVRNENNEIPAEHAGRLIFSTESAKDLPCVGDWVYVQYTNEASRAIIHSVLPRKSFLRRKTAGDEVDYQMIAANIDVAFIMQSCDTDYNLRRLERYLVMTKEGHVEPVILLSKSDLLDQTSLDEILAEIRETYTGIRVAAFSSETPGGVDIVRRLMDKGRTYCLVGSSGVGKTTLLNALLGRDEYETTPIREKDGRGRHTTAFRQLTVLENGSLIVDTPGMREVGVIVESDIVDDTFSDITELAGDCRFNDCTHTVEVGCAILSAVEQGTMDEERYRGYIKLMKEAAFHQMSYVEKRRKDKKFGHMVKSVMKHSRKK